MEESAVEWLVEQIKQNVHNSFEEFESLIEQAKEMEAKQRKNDFIGGYLTHAMKNNKLPYGFQYLLKVALFEEKAEKLYNKNLKSK